MTPSRGIYLRLIVPLGTALLLGMLATWAIAVKLLTDASDRRLDDQLAQATALLADGAFPFSPDLLAQLDRLIEARIVLLDSEGNVALTSATDERIGELWRSASPDLPTTDTAVSLQTLGVAGNTYRSAAQLLRPGRDSRFTTVAAVASLDDSRKAARDAALTLGISMLLVTAVLAWVGHHFTAIARSSRLAGRGDLASRVAHEIRNPLTAIKMQLQLLEETAAASEKTRIAKLLNEIRRMDMIVESALTLGAPIELRLDHVDADELVRELGELVRPALEHRGVELQLATDSGVAVPADGDRLRQALINLINNAADELGQGGVIRLSCHLSGNRLLELIVEDSGPGIRGDIADLQSNKPFGLGLGLTICREIAALHKGELVAGSSGDLGGAKFTIRLPVPIIGLDTESS